MGANATHIGGSPILGGSYVWKERVRQYRPFKNEHKSRPSTTIGFFLLLLVLRYIHFTTYVFVQNTPREYSGYLRS